MIEIIGLILIFIAGASIGSFLNVVADRLPKDESPLKGRSMCDFCKTLLKPKDLFPIFSFALLKGRCRYCDRKLSIAYPLSELLTGLLFVGLAYSLDVFSIPNYAIWISFAYLAFIVSVYVIILFADFKYKIIPNKVVIPAIVVVILVMIVSTAIISYLNYKSMAADPFGKYLLEVGYWHQQVYAHIRNLVITIVSAFGIAGFFWLLIIITRGKGMGGGDVKLAFLIGLVNGFPVNLVAIVLGFVSGALYSTGLMIFRRKGMKDVIPFGPFLILGSVLAFIFGQQLFNWYVSLI